MPDISQDVAREHLLDQVFGTRTFAEIAVAREALRDWIIAHPDEPGMSDAFEVLSHREDLMNEQETLRKVELPVAVR